MIAAHASDVSWWTSAVIAALVSGGVAITTFLLAAWRQRVDRQRQLFGDAFAAYAEYREFPFIVWRRNPEEPTAERVRISGRLSDVQARLTEYSARLRVEAPRVAKAWSNLIVETRQIAGGAIRDAWDQPPAAADHEMHAPHIDMARLQPAEDIYLWAVADRLSVTPGLVRRTWRRCSKRGTDLRA